MMEKITIPIREGMEASLPTEMLPLTEIEFNRLLKTLKKMKPGLVYTNPTEGREDEL